MMKRSMPKSPSHTLLAFCFWCIHLLCLVERCKVQAGTNFTTDPDEARALKAIFQQWGLSVTSDWNISGNPCSGTAVDSSTISDDEEGARIKCNCTSNGGGTCHITVMSVRYYSTERRRVFPEELLNLTYLANLTVSEAGIEGPLPSFIGNFRHLQHLDIHDNNFNGSLPPEIGTLSSLEYLDISSNNFNGSLPPEIGTLPSLEYLYIGDNGFNGLLPPELGNLSSLQELDMSSSGLGGEIPSTFAKLKNMKILRASDSQLTKIPNFIGNWNLTELYVSNNNITGPLAAFIGNITSLLELDVSKNYMTGPLPASIGNLKHLSYLDLSRNYITGPLPASIGNLMNLSTLSVSMNAISGSIPRELGNLRNLTSLGISSNNFTGSLPPELGNLTSLQELYIDSCGLSGQIPSTFARLRNLNTLSASDNNFTGKIPDFIGSWALTDLSMQGNAFEGPIPSSFSNLTSLMYLRLSDVSNGRSSLNFIENMTSLHILVLRNNMLFGTIPSTIVKHQSLKHMDLSFNNLIGPIPASLFFITSLANLFLGNNGLSGTLPSQKGSTLLNIDLSYNYLSGSFPSWVSEDLNLNLVFNNFPFNDFSGSGLPLSLNCLQRSYPCRQKSPIQSSFAIRCGGPPRKTNDTEYEGDNEPLGPVSYKVASTGKWAVSNVGIFAANRYGSDYMFEGSNGKYNRHNEGVFHNTTDSELFQYARVSPGSLRYYGLGLENGNYTVNLKFAETEFPDSKTWESVGKRVFDIYLQGNLAWKDFDIKKEAGIAFKGIEKKQWVMVNEHILEIHLLWAGKGTCCIPLPGTYGPAISAIHVTPNFRTRRKKNKSALAVGISASVALSIVSVSVFLIWKRSKRLSVDEDEDEGVNN